MLLFLCDYAICYAPIMPFYAHIYAPNLPIMLDYANYAQIMLIMLKLCHYAKLCNYAKLCSSTCGAPARGPPPSPGSCSSLAQRGPIT